MSNSFGRALAWFFAVLFAFGGLSSILMVGFSKGIGEVFPIMFIEFIGGSAWCFYLWKSGKKIKVNEAEDARLIEQAMAQPLQEIRPRQAIIKGEEKAYGAIEASLQEEKTIGYKAGTQGMSVRVAKGVTLRTSGTRAMPVKGMVEVSHGELVITNKRIIFAGDRKSFTISIDSLLSTTTYADGFGFTDGERTYAVQTAKGSAHTLFAVALTKVTRG